MKPHQQTRPPILPRYVEGHRRNVEDRQKNSQYQQKSSRNKKSQYQQKSRRHEEDQLNGEESTTMEQQVPKFKLL